MTKAAIAALLGRRARSVPATVNDPDGPDANELVFERRRHWSVAPAEVRIAIVSAVVSAVVSATRRKRRVWTVSMTIAVVPVVAAAASTSFHPAWWTVCTVALAAAAARQVLATVTPYPQGHELFDRARWFGPLTPTAARKILTAEQDDHRHANQLTPRPTVADRPEVAATLAGLVELDQVTAATCTVEPFRSLLAPRIEHTAPGLTDAVRSLAATSRYAQRPLHEVVSVAARTYTRTPPATDGHPRPAAWTTASATSAKGAPFAT